LDFHWVNMKIQPFTFYYWKERYVPNNWATEDICFIIDIDFKSDPKQYQCHGIEIKNIQGNMIPGHGYTFHYYKNDNNIEYTIKKISIDDIDKKLFFDWLFDNKSKLHIGIKTNQEFGNLK